MARDPLLELVETLRELGPHAPLTISNLEEAVVVRMGEGEPQITSGVGGHEQVERPRDKPITSWSGEELKGMSIPILLDGIERGRGVQKLLDKVLAFGMSEDGEEPRPMIITGPIPWSGRPYRWVYDSTPEMGSSIRDTAGKLLRQFLTLNVIEYVPADQIRIKRRRHGTHRRYTAKKGDTVLKIAKRFDDDGKRVREYARKIAKANDIRDIRKELEAGTHLRIPPG